MKSKSKFKIIISAVLAISVVFSTFAFLNASAEENDKYGTYDNGISGNKYGIMTLDMLDSFNNGNFEEGLKYWGVHNPGNGHTATAKVVNENANAYVDLKVTGYAGLYSAPFTMADLKTGDYIGLRFKMKKVSGDGSLRCWIMNKNYDNTPAAGNNFTVSPTENWETYYIKAGLSSLVLADDSTVNNGKLRIAISITGNNISESGLEVCIDEVEIIKFYKDSSNNFFAYTDSNGNWYNGKNQPLYGTENEGIIRSGNGNNSINDYINSLDAIPALEKIENFDFANGLVNFGTMNKTTSKKTLAEDGTTLYTDGNGNRMIKIESSTDYAYCGFRSVFIKLADAAKGKNVFVSGDISTDMPLLCRIDSLVDGAVTAGNWGSNMVLTLATSGGELKRVNSLTGTTVSADATAVSVNIRQQEYAGSAKSGTSYIDNLNLYYIDEGGLDLPASIDGTPVDYALGDVNADKSVNICDLVAMNNKKTDSSETIYYAAAKLDGTTVATITDTDISSMRSMLLNK